MRKLALIFGIMSLSVAAMAQSITAQPEEKKPKNILNHMDVGVSLGTMGFGIDLAMPVTDWVRVRAGYSCLPFTLGGNFPIQTRTGTLQESGLQKFIDKRDQIDYYLDKYNLNLNDPSLAVYKEKLDQFRDVEMKDHVSMNLKPNMHQFKFLVDIMPIPGNKHWTLTTGFYAGSSNIGTAVNQEKETMLLKAVNAYNDIYTLFCMHDEFGGHGAIPEIEDPVRNNGIAGFFLGYFENGDKAFMVPDKDGKAKARMTDVWKVRPYVGLGFNTHLSKNHRWNLNVDAGVMFMGGKPKVFVDNVYRIEDPIAIPQDYYDAGFIAEDLADYGDIVRPKLDMTGYEVYREPLQNVDMLNDIHDIPGKVGSAVRTAHTLTKVYPNLSVTFSYRLF